MRNLKKNVPTDQSNLKKQPNTRRLKIQPKYVERTYKTIYQPAITLTGQWLRDLGFECNSHVLIEEKKGCLTIRLVLPEME